MPVSTVRLVRVPAPAEVLALLPASARRLLFASVAPGELENFHACLDVLAAAHDGSATHLAIEEVQVNKIARGTHAPTVFLWKQVGEPRQMEECDEAALGGAMLVHSLRMQQRLPRGLRLLDSVGRTLSMSIQ